MIRDMTPSERLDALQQQRVDSDMLYRAERAAGEAMGVDPVRLDGVDVEVYFGADTPYASMAVDRTVRHPVRLTVNGWVWLGIAAACLAFWLAVWVLLA